MMVEPTIAAGYASALMELAESRGVSRQELTLRSGIDRRELQNRDGRIPLAKYVTLMRVGKELSEDPALALHFGETVDMSEVSIVPMMGSPGASLAESVTLLNRYARLDIDLPGERFQLSEIHGQTWMVDTRANPNEFPELTESAFARMVCSTRRWIGDVRIFKALHVTHAEPVYSREYDRIFQMPVVFESDRNALLLATEMWSSFTLPFSSTYASSVLTAHAEELLENLESSRSVRGRVEALLLPVLQSGRASMDGIAEKLGLSRQTLFRKLKGEGVTFEKVLDELRHGIALHCLNEKKMSVQETAYLVGFSDPAAFSRAFKRWTGSSPRRRRSVKE